MIIVNARFLTQKTTGVQRFAVEISKRLHKLSDQIVFVSPHNILDKELASELGAIVIGYNKGTLWEQIDLRRYLISNGKPLLVNFCNTGMLFYDKQVVTIHDMSYKINPGWFSRKFYLWYNFLIPHLTKHSLKILTVSNSSKEDIVKYLDVRKDKISVIYNSSYLNTNDTFETICHEKYLLSVSSLNPRKNLNNLIKAFEKLESRINLVIVGLKSDNFAVNELDIGKNVIVKGYVSDDELAALMKNAEAFVYLSFYEGFGLPPVEAMSMGCPVIVSDINSHREVCGNSALYADPYDVEDIKNKITEVLENDRLKYELIVAGKKNIERFDWSESARNVLKDINAFIK
jgi:glycosyltransferase involved in cell wall biosynthesis